MRRGSLGFEILLPQRWADSTGLTAVLKFSSSVIITMSELFFLFFPPKEQPSTLPSRVEEVTWIQCSPCEHEEETHIKICGVTHRCDSSVQRQRQWPGGGPAS